MAITLSQFSKKFDNKNTLRPLEFSYLKWSNFIVSLRALNLRPLVAPLLCSDATVGASGSLNTIGPYLTISQVHLKSQQKKLCTCTRLQLYGLVSVPSHLHIFCTAVNRAQHVSQHVLPTQMRYRQQQQQQQQVQWEVRVSCQWPVFCLLCTRSWLEYTLATQLFVSLWLTTFCHNHSYYFQHRQLQLLQALTAFYNCLILLLLPYFDEPVLNCSSTIPWDLVKTES